MSSVTHVGWMILGGVEDVLAKAGGNSSKCFEDFDWHHLQGQMRYISNHLLIHDPVTFPHPRCEIWMSQKLLDRDRQCSVEGGERVIEHSLLAVSERIYDSDTMSPIQSP